MPVFDEATRAELKAIVKEAILETKDGAVILPAEDDDELTVWRGRLYSDPDSLGRVRLKVVEKVLVPRYGDTIKFKELTMGGLVDREVTIPRMYFIPETRDESPTADVAVGSAAFYQNRAYHLKSTTNWFGKVTQVPDIDRQIPGTLASQFTADKLGPILEHLADRIANDKGANQFYFLREDELSIG